MKRTRSLVVVEVWRTRRETAYAMTRTERAAKRERTVVRSITKVEGLDRVSMSAKTLDIFREVSLVFSLERNQYRAVEVQLSPAIYSDHWRTKSVSNDRITALDALTAVFVVRRILQSTRDFYSCNTMFTVEWDTYSINGLCSQCFAGLIEVEADPT